MSRYEGPPTRKALEHYDRMLEMAERLEQLGPELADEAVRLSTETEVSLERAIEFVKRHGETTSGNHGETNFMDWLVNHRE